MQNIQNILQKLFRHQAEIDFDLDASSTILLAHYAYFPIKELLDFKPTFKIGYQEALKDLETRVGVDPATLVLLKGIAGIKLDDPNTEHHLLEAQRFHASALGYSYLALYYFLNENFEQALHVYTEAIDHFPKEPYFYACRCVINRALEDDEGAFYDYQIAKRLDFNYHSLLEWQEHLPFLTELKREHTEIQELETSLQHDTDNLEIMVKLALEYVHIYDYQAALRLYHKGLEIVGDNPELYVYRAAIYTKLTIYIAAIHDCNQAIEIDRNCVPAYVLRAKLQECLKDDQKAISDYQQAELINPAQSTIYEERASLFERMGKFEDAIRDYSTLINLLKDDFYPYTLRADLFERLERWEDALGDYNEAILLNPYYSDLYQYRAAVKENLGDRAGAEEDLKKFEELEEEYE
ncbi:hypothetical protein LZQ00_08780 [Sphingobacterium sp. SRCM116780]|uniref:tetratricopeptide repeat protein n=1 Tax=Sphingobacterium sp. SRCM116780 TaxID=2907623 RepID=UPI001F3D4E01|nr:hypothetical protein [Sphingobacterium sp. SRCM116780]UIR57901.1 hypothetical protein LZQ00_08780 [Sphingobacterium sp. SRCM116780]